MNTLIDYRKIAKAISYYEARGYQYIEVPWAVSEQALNITRPAGTALYPYEDKLLVASAEQSFFEMIIRNELEKGKYITVTPCFREESEINDFTRKYFVKAELIDTIQPTLLSLERTVNMAVDFFKLFIDTVEVVQIGDTYDIQGGGIELGSYGIRNNKLVGDLIYATACAEPRLSAVQNFIQNKS